MKKLLLLLLGIVDPHAQAAADFTGADLGLPGHELPAKHCNLFAKYDKAQFETALPIGLPGRPEILLRRSKPSS